jgi:hypothetical protein
MVSGWPDNGSLSRNQKPMYALKSEVLIVTMINKRLYCIVFYFHFTNPKGYKTTGYRTCQKSKI